MIDVSGETPFLIVENGWATAASLGGSEAKQAAYLANTFKALTEHRDSFDRHIWYNLHDGRPENCATSALSFFPPDFDPSSVGEFWGHFEDYLCTLGLRYNDGQPKEGWGVFQESLSSYTGVS